MELFSEAMAKLLGVAGSSLAQDAGDGAGDGVDTARAWPIDDDPARDGRVAWLISELGGRQALLHRYEDMRRRRYGGKWRDDGYRQVQLEPEHADGLSVEPDDPHHEQDLRTIWNGMLAAAQSIFKPGDDVLIVLDLMAQDEEIQAGFGSEWPIGMIVTTLNRQNPNRIWTDDRVDNAKKRLKNWIGRMQREHGLDAADLMDLFARYARRGNLGGAATSAARASHLAGEIRS